MSADPIQPDDQVKPVDLQQPAVDPKLEAKAQAAGRDVERMMKGDEDHQRDLGRFFDGVSKLEKRVPALIDFGFKVSHQVAQWATEKHVATKQLTLGDIFWTPSGEMGFDVIYDPFDITPKDVPLYLKKGWARVPQLVEQFPCVVDLIMTVGTHLSAMIDNKQIKGELLEFAQLHYFFNAVSKRPAWGFTILHKDKRLRTKTVGF